MKKPIYCIGRILWSSIFFCSFGSVNAQNFPKLSLASYQISCELEDIDTTVFVQHIEAFVNESNNSISSEELNRKTFRPLSEISLPKKINLLHQDYLDLWLRFNITNPSFCNIDSVRVTSNDTANINLWFSAHFSMFGYFKTFRDGLVHIDTMRRGDFTFLPSNNLQVRKYFFPLKVIPGDTVECLLNIRFIPAYNYFIEPELWLNDHLDQLLQLRVNDRQLYYGLFWGVIYISGFLSLFMIFNFLLNRDKNYGLYAIYMILTFIYALRLWEKDITGGSFLAKYPMVVHAFEAINSYLIFAIFFVFVTSFLELKETNPILHKVLKYATYIILAFTLYDFVLLLFFHLNKIQIDGYDDYLRHALHIFVIIYYFFLLKYVKKPGSIFIKAGIFFLIFGLLLSYFWFFHPIYNDELKVILKQIPFSSFSIKYPMIYYLVGLLLESLFFAGGLGFKTKKIQDKKEELLREKEQIQRDLHEGVSSVLTGVTLQIALASKEKVTLAQKNKSFDIISNIIDDVQTRIRQIVYTTKVLNLDIPELFNLLRKHASNSLGQEKIIIEYDLEPQPFKGIDTSYLYLYNIVMIGYEAITNIAKHAKECTVVRITAKKSGNDIHLEISDNGIGFDPSKFNNYNKFLSGMGLKNLRSRAENLNGFLEIISLPNQGTKIILHSPLAASVKTTSFMWIKKRFFDLFLQFIKPTIHEKQ